MNLLLFLFTILVSFIIVRIGAIALELTGLEWSLAKFQSLSCFTGTGFTTREAELITGNPRRRRIATYMIVLGHAGFVTLIATFANSLRPSTFVLQFTLPFLDTVFPVHILPWINLVIIVVAVIVLIKIMSRSGFRDRLTKRLRSFILKRKMIKPVSFEELLIATGGYGVSTIDVEHQHYIRDKTISRSELSKQGIITLAIEHEGIITPNPPPNTRISAGDKLICFGKLDTIRHIIAGHPLPSAGH